MKIILDTDDMEVDAKCEALRSLVFDEQYNVYQHKKYKQRGCYSTFNTRSDFVDIEPDTYPKLNKCFDWCRDREYNDIEVCAVESSDIVSMWAWDGDGTLLVYIKGENYYYINSDCKCSYDWSEIEI